MSAPSNEDTNEVTLGADVERTLAETKSAKRARFVFTPDNWFEFEDAAEACARHGVSLELSLTEGGSVPHIAGLGLEQLQLLRDGVGHAWPRFQPGAQPSALRDPAFDELRAALREALRARASSAAAPTATLRMPPPNATWNTDPARRVAWWEQLFGRSHMPLIGQWLVDLLPDHLELLETADGAWLRALIHRVALEQHLPELLAWLRASYAPLDRRQALVEQDQRFAAEFDLTRFGGPWAERLGLTSTTGRAAPFEIGAPSSPANQAPNITVLIPSYRHEEYIADSLRSVLAQRHSALTVIVADDCSPDETAARARSIEDARVDVRVNEQNLGLGNSVLRALEHIETPYVALLNSDDLLHPDHLAQCLEVLERDAGAQLITTGISLIDDGGGGIDADNVSLVLDGKKIHDWVQWFERARPEGAIATEELFSALLERNFLVTSSNLVARTDWLKAQAEALQSLKYCLDWQLFLQASLEGSLRPLPAPLIAYRLHATNTVWFREGRRWAYYLEVNRVAAEAIQRYLASGPGDPKQRFSTVIAAVAQRLTANTEVDGLALFLNAVLDRVQLDAAASDDAADVQRFIELLNQHASVTVAPDAADAPPQPDADAALGMLAREQVQIERTACDALDRQVEDLSARLEASSQAREKLDAEKSTLYRDQEARISRANEQEQRISKLYEDQRDRIHQAEQQELRLRDAYGNADDHRKQREQAESQLGALQNEVDAAQRQLAQAKSQYQGLERSKDDVQARLDARKQDLSQANQARREAEQKLQRAHQQVERAKEDLARETAQVEALGETKSLLSKQVRELQQEIERLLQTNEFRLGNFLWNKLPLGRISRMAKKWYQRLFNAKDRAKMKRRSSKQREGTAVVAACWQWPIYSHTFVYQEMVSLQQTGLDVQLFHWDLGGTDQLHAAFQYLYDNRTQLQPEWGTHKKDKEHFEQTRPGRLRAFLERISPLCGKSVEELEKAPIVMQACTFARMAELANARYLHSYFFYDQSFMAMLAAWLLELPRGVSCYADHMMDDYEFKFVPLHIELADVVIATSARIKQELSELSGGKFDDKIVVKPNGVDGERFPPRSRPLRASDEPFEVLSVSRIEPKKGLTHLVEAMAELKQRGHTVIAHIIGSKDPNSAGSVEYSEMFERCIAEHGLQDQVILHGMMKQEEMPPIIEKCRAFVAPYVETESGDKDGIPTAMLEALASSLPIITTNSGSITEVVDDGVEGLVVAQRDSMAYAEALAKIIGDPKLEQQMAAAARARFDRDFDIQVTEKRLHERIHGFLDAQD